jgi:hypothetical protein
METGVEIRRPQLPINHHGTGPPEGMCTSYGLLGRHARAPIDLQSAAPNLYAYVYVYIYMCVCVRMSPITP